VFALRGEKSRLGQEAPSEEDAELAELREETLRRGQGALAQKDAQTAKDDDLSSCTTAPRLRACRLRMIGCTDVHQIFPSPPLQWSV
jgi:hypothetical protein